MQNKINDWERQQYAQLVQKILHSGEKRSSRAGDTYSLFGETLDIDISTSFPLLRGRRLFYKPVLGELAAMLRGPKTIEDFKKFNCNYWDAWDDGAGNINVDYGNAWIDFNGVNQLEDVVDKLINNPTDRRILISGWRPDNLPDLSLPCCHLLYQWYVRDGKYLDMIWYQRSVDTMVGLPSDIILAAAWTAVLASQTGYKPGKIKMMLGDTHIYANHVQGTLDYLRQLNSMPLDEPKHHYAVSPNATVYNFKPEMIDIVDYEPADKIKFELNV